MTTAKSLRELLEYKAPPPPPKKEPPKKEGTPTKRNVQWCDLTAVQYENAFSAWKMGYRKDPELSQAEGALVLRHNKLIRVFYPDGSIFHLHTDKRKTA